MGLRIAIVVIAAAGGFVAVTGQELPATVASRFDLSGQANTSMSRGGYLGFMVGLATALPGLMLLLGRALRGSNARLLNIPHREHWLAPERREQTAAYVTRHLDLLAAGVAIFIAVMHLLVVRANRTQPPELPTDLFLGAVAVFVLATGAWAAAFMRRFRKPPGPR